MIEGDRVSLRTMTRDDADDVVRWRNDPFVIDQLFSDESPTRASHLRWFETMTARGDRHEFIIIERATNRPIGVIGLSSIDQKNRRAEYGILIGETDARGQGCAHEASRLILTYAFYELGLHRVFLHVLADNVTALNLYQRLGFRIEGTLRDHVCKRGMFRDVIVMAILSGERMAPPLKADL